MITKERILEAYERTGLKPVSCYVLSDDYTNPDVVVCGCAIGALLLDCDTEEAKELRERFDQFQIPPQAVDIAPVLGLDIDSVYSIEGGFDRGFEIGGFPLVRDQQFLEAFDAGVAMREKAGLTR